MVENPYILLIRKPLCSGHLSIADTFFGPAGVRYTQVWLYTVFGNYSFSFVCYWKLRNFRYTLKHKQGVTSSDWRPFVRNKKKDGKGTTKLIFDMFLPPLKVTNPLTVFLLFCYFFKTMSHEGQGVRINSYENGSTMIHIEHYIHFWDTKHQIFRDKFNFANFCLWGNEKTPHNLIHFLIASIIYTFLGVSHS